jgi:hypothetical protein
MEYTECYICDYGQFAQLVFLVLLALAALLGVRRRAWTFVAALSVLPLAEWYMEGLGSGLAAMVAILIGTIVALTVSRTRRGRSADSGLTSA